jgi:hypothetical protein
MGKQCRDRAQTLQEENTATWKTQTGSGVGKEGRGDSLGWSGPWVGTGLGRGRARVQMEGTGMEGGWDGVELRWRGKARGWGRGWDRGGWGTCGVQYPIGRAGLRGP